MPELNELNPQTSTTILIKIAERLKTMRQNDKLLKEEK